MATLQIYRIRQYKIQIALFFAILVLFLVPLSSELSLEPLEKSPLPVPPVAQHLLQQQQPHEDKHESEKQGLETSLPKNLPAEVESEDVKNYINKFIIFPDQYKIARALPGTQTPDKDDFNMLDVLFSGSGNTRINAGASIKMLPSVSQLPRTEKFPVSNQHKLPTESYKSLPVVQASSFYSQSSAQQSERQQRLDTIRNAFLASWKTYKAYAWGADEIRPISQVGINPFTGWGASLIDALDTMQIMGLTSEFRDAVNYVDSVDFSATFRNSIPMFEIVIRYLGGLISAYDLSGQKEAVLLAKAIQLGDNLIGAFDTPNRMPRLHFKWQDADWKFRELSGSSSNIAEIASMNMEFTRLAQLTGNNSYFDAVHRITVALSEVAPNLIKPYLFPGNVDSSGCLVVPIDDEELPSNEFGNELQASFAESSALVASNSQNATSSNSSLLKSPSTLSASSITTSVSTLKSSTTSSLTSQPLSPSSESSNSTESFSFTKSALQTTSHPGASLVTHTSATAYANFKSQATLNFNKMKREKLSHSKYSPVEQSEKISFAKEIPETKKESFDYVQDYRIIKGEEHPEIFGRQEISGTIRKVISIYNDGESLITGCQERGIYAGSSTGTGVGIGGGTDSAYEYYVKEYALLNGGMSMYQDLYEKTIDAATENLMYRPMVEGNPDILFMGGRVNRGNNFWQYDNSMSHLTCFVGGMYALGSKMFNRPKDLEYARKLTDGCVWAYNITDTGVMPEWFSVRRCPSAPSSGGSAPSCNFDASTADQISREENSNLLEKLHAQGISTGSLDASVQVTDSGSSNGAHNKPASFLQMVPSYALRPEALESVFYMYRVTGDREWQEKGWNMISSILQLTAVPDALGNIIGYSGVTDVTDNRRQGPNETTGRSLFLDYCESFWYAETLKYAYLIFDDNDKISLDRYIFNTEGHPFERPT